MSIQSERSESEGFKNPTQEEKLLIIQLHIQEKFLLEAAITAVMVYKCNTLLDAKNTLENRKLVEHLYLQIEQQNVCAICQLNKELHKDSEMNEEIIKLKKILEKEVQQLPTCLICYERKFSNQIVVFQGASHLICKNCFEVYLNVEISQGNINLTCPHCDIKITIQEIAQFCPNQLMKFQKFQRNQQIVISQKIIWCTECKKHFSIENSETTQSCPLCKKQYCASCKQNFHPEQTCAQVLQQEFGMQQNQKQCPRCRMMIEKVSGCDTMLCTFCKTRWCWNCGKQCTFFHQLFCIAHIPGYNPEKPPNCFIQFLWYIIWLTMLFLIGFIIFQIILFEELFKQPKYKQASKIKKSFLFIICCLFCLILFPFTTVLYLLSLLPLLIIYLVVLISESANAINPAAQAQFINQEQMVN